MFVNFVIKMLADFVLFISEFFQISCDMCMIQYSRRPIMFRGNCHDCFRYNNPTFKRRD